MWLNILLVTVGGSVGAVSRWGLSSVTQSLVGHRFYAGTMAVNWIGCFLFGLVIAAVSEHWRLHPHVRLLLLVGFMGSFTTFSTYAYEAAELFRHPDGRWVSAVLHVVLQNIVGIALIFAGLGLGTWLKPGTSIPT